MRLGGGEKINMTCKKLRKKFKIFKIFKKIKKRPH
jgi:hypothetical protein